MLIKNIYIFRQYLEYYLRSMITFFFMYETLLSFVLVSVKSLNLSFKQSEYFELMNVLIN